VRRRDVEAQLKNQPGEPRGLTFGQVEDEPGQGGGVNDRMLQRALESAADQPAVEGIMAVLDEDGAVRETQERPAGIAKLGRSDQHRPVDVMPLLGVRVDRCAAVDKRVEEGERAGKRESLRAELEDKERSVPCGLDVDGDKLRIVEARLRPELRRIDGDLLPDNRLRGPARLEIDRLHIGRLSSAERMN